MTKEKESTGALGWGDEVDPSQQGGGYTLLPEGPAFFTVQKLKRERKPYGSFGVINVAVLRLLCMTESGESQTAEIDVQLGLHTDLSWKLTQFFTSIGQRKHGDSGKFVPNWAAVEGAEGLCKIGHRKFAKKSEKDKPKAEWTGVTNEVEAFLDPVEEPAKDNLKFD